MGARLRSWWQQIKRLGARFRSLSQKIKQYRRAIGVVVVVVFIVVVVIVLIIAVVMSNGTGFNGYNKVSKVHTISGPSAGTVTITEEYQPGKTLWDLLQLLIVPVVLAIGGFWLNQIQKSREEKTTEQQAKTEREIAEDNQRERALQEYIDKISELLLEKDLRESQPEDEVRTIARVRTLTVLPRLDGDRKRSVLLFLHESGLIDRNRSIIDLDGADLRNTDLSGADLDGADLGKANLSKADLVSANLSNADLSHTNLEGAFLIGANRNGADLTDALVTPETQF